MSEVSVTTISIAKERLISDMVFSASRHVYQVAVTENSLIDKTPIRAREKNG